MRKYISTIILSLCTPGLLFASSDMSRLGVVLLRAGLESANSSYKEESEQERLAGFVQPQELFEMVDSGHPHSVAALDYLVLYSMICDREGHSMVSANKASAISFADGYRIELLRLLKQQECPRWVKRRVVSVLNVTPDLPDRYIASALPLLKETDWCTVPRLITLLVGVQDWSLRSDLYTAILDCLTYEKMSDEMRQTVFRVMQREFYREGCPVGCRFMKRPNELADELWAALWPER